MKTFQRSSGILLHPSSLPGPHGIGDLGQEAYRFVDFLALTKQTWWQTLPLGPLGFENSPYNSPSAFAGNPLFISLDELVESGLLEPHEIEPWDTDNPELVDYDQVKSFKEPHIRRAFDRFMSNGTQLQLSQFNSFCKTHQEWLNIFVRFCVLKKLNNNKSWLNWTIHDLDIHDPSTAREQNFYRFSQYLFWSQWKSLKSYANNRGIKIIGDIPIFVALDSADVWANQHLFQLKSDGSPLVVAGVPPDYFSEDGQLWGNPLYDWPQHKETHYHWWMSRLANAFELFDCVRLDHFIGFHRAWAVPLGSQNARHGQWQAGPGEDFFKTALKKLKNPSFIAEDLGLIIPEVEELRDRFGFLGMKVLQFSFGDPDNSECERPLDFPRNAVAYTGTHDNNTMQGWFDDVKNNPKLEIERQFALDYAEASKDDAVWGMIRLVAQTPCLISIIPTQDLLELGSYARMNTPATSTHNWTWKMKPDALTKSIAARLRQITEQTNRENRRRSKKIKLLQKG